MTVSTKFTAQALAVLVASALALTACTNASNTDANSKPASTGSAAATFDPGTLKKDEELAALVPAAIKSKGTLTIGITPTYAPAQFLSGPNNNTPVGYDIDFAKAIGTTLGLEIDLRPADFPSILPALGPKYDLGIASFTITQKRLQAVNFVSYFSAGTTWAVQKGNPKNFSLEDICGRSVGVQTGTTQEEPDLKERNEKCLAEGKKPIDVVSLKTQTDITTRLVNGSIDAMSADSPVIGYAAQQTNGAVEKIGDMYGAALAGIGIAKDDKALSEVIQKVVTKLMADGTYTKILDSWTVSDGAIAKSEVNPSVPS
ncbi:ABC transporter substrate-binding protein [Pseudarthrobacter sulfonivorans]|nr:ABC transporter substrate-binding protein [Pseudarthrobacter sulfonivorans]